MSDNPPSDPPSEQQGQGQDSKNQPKPDSPPAPKTLVNPPSEDGVSPEALAAASHDLVVRKDRRWQRWGLYGMLMLVILCAIITFLWIVKSAWLGKTEASVIAFGQISPSVAALLGVVVTALVALPLSLSLALVRLVSEPKDKDASGESSALTTAFFEFGKAFAEGIKFFRERSGS